jgi:hypothetical protein
MRLSSAIVVIAAFGLGTGCVNEQEQQAAVELQKLFGAQDCKIGRGFSADTGKGSKKTVTLTLEGVSDFDQYKNKEYITSTAALMYFELQKPEELAGYSEIDVTATSGSNSFEKSYALVDMQSVAPALHTVRTYFELLKEDRIPELPGLVERSHFDDSTMAVIMNGMHALDSLYGPQQSATILGYKMDHTIDGNEPVVVCWSESINGDNNSTQFQFYLNRESKKIIYIGVNDIE